MTILKHSFIVKESKGVQNGQPRCFFILWARLDPYGPFETENYFFTQKHPRQTLLCPYWATD